jgi:hypothetical protein
MELLQNKTFGGLNRDTHIYQKLKEVEKFIDDRLDQHSAETQISTRNIAIPPTTSLKISHFPKNISCVVSVFCVPIIFSLP